MNSGLDFELLEGLSHYSKKIVDNHLAAGPGGNISVKEQNVMWISPSGYSLNDIPNNGWVPVDITTGRPLTSSLKPSSELTMHLEIYRSREDVDAIVHTHPPITIGVISTDYNSIPPMFPDYVAIVGEVPFIEYVEPCTDELAAAVKNVLKNHDYNALFMKNHGLITLGKNLKQAYYRTEVIEDAAKIFWVSNSLGKPKVLGKEDIQKLMDSEAEKYRQRLLDKS